MNGTFSDGYGFNAAAKTRHITARTNFPCQFLAPRGVSDRVFSVCLLHLAAVKSIPSWWLGTEHSLSRNCDQKFWPLSFALRKMGDAVMVAVRCRPFNKR